MSSRASRRGKSVSYGMKVRRYMLQSTTTYDICLSIDCIFEHGSSGGLHLRLLLTLTFAVNTRPGDSPCNAVCVTSKSTSIPESRLMLFVDVPSKSRPGHESLRHCSFCWTVSTYKCQDVAGVAMRLQLKVLFLFLFLLWNSSGGCCSRL